MFGENSPRHQASTHFNQSLQLKISNEQKVAENFRKSIELPLKLKWLAAITIVVSVTLISTSSMVYFSQLQSMRHFIIDSGSSLAKLIAIENAELVLSEDWVAVEILVDNLKDNREFTYIYITDHNNILRGSSTQTGLSKPFEFAGAALEKQINDNAIVRDWQSFTDGPVFDFEVAVTFQQKKVGTVHLGLSQSSLTSAANITMWMMLLLFVVTIVSVIIVTYLLIIRITRSITQINRSIVNAINGNFERLDTAPRQDEFGTLVSNVNKLLTLFSQHPSQQFNQEANDENQNDSPCEDEMPEQPLPSALHQLIDCDPDETMIQSKNTNKDSHKED